MPLLVFTVGGKLSSWCVYRPLCPPTSSVCNSYAPPDCTSYGVKSPHRHASLLVRPSELNFLRSRTLLLCAEWSPRAPFPPTRIDLLCCLKFTLTRERHVIVPKPCIYTSSPGCLHSTIFLLLTPDFCIPRRFPLQMVHQPGRFSLQRANSPLGMELQWSLDLAWQGF